MRLRDSTSGYDYIYTHVDNLEVVATNPSIWIKQIASVFIVKQHNPRKHYLDHDYTYHDG